MMEAKDSISTICFILKHENNQLVSFNGQSITFRLSIKESSFIKMPKTLIKSRLHSNIKKLKYEPELNNTKSNFPQNPQTYKKIFTRKRIRCIQINLRLLKLYE